MAYNGTQVYAQVLWSAAQQESANPKKLVAQLAKHLESEGRSKMLPGILRSFQQLAARNTKLGMSVEVSHAGESAGALKEAAARGIHAEHAHVNPSLIKGWRASGDGKLVDASAKRALIELYRNITTHA
jgi:F0F1-type ATP synthase delta subunit